MTDTFVFIEHLQGVVADISYVCLAQAQAVKKALGGSVVAVLMGQGVTPLAKDLLADEVLVVEDAALKEFVYDQYMETLAKLVSEKKPGLFLFGDTSVGSDLSGGLSARLNIPLVSFCKEIKLEGGKPRFVSQICGGKIFAEGALPAETTLVTLLPGKFKPAEGQSASAPKVTTLGFTAVGSPKIKCKEVILPSGEDVDISKEKILVAIGRGIENEDNVSLAQELADALGGVLCASRPVVDQGWLSTSRLVGKSGKTVKPKLYLALGISGAPEHVEAIEGSELIIAINTDANAPIFGMAKFGSTEHAIDLCEELIQSVREARGG